MVINGWVTLVVESESCIGIAELMWELFVYVRRKFVSCSMYYFGFQPMFI